MIILCDADGVINQWQKNFDAHCSRIAPHISFPFQTNNTSWDMSVGLDEEGLEVLNQVLTLPGFYSELDPEPGAREALNEMQAVGHDVFIVTSPYLTNPTCASDKLDWVEREMGEGWGARTIITSDKTLVRGDILIDDKPVITGAAKPLWEHVLFEQPYNVDHVNERRVLTEWANWRDIIDPTWSDIARQHAGVLV